MNMNLDEASIYVGTYTKYNSGSLFGKWLDLSDYSDEEEFIEACLQLHQDEADPELMFQDWEHIPEGLIGESWLSDNFFSLRDTLDSLSSQEHDAFCAWCTYSQYDISTQDIDDLITAFRDEYIGQYSSEEDYAEELIEECYDLSEFAKTYFDYEKFAHELFTTDYWYDDGYVFMRR